MKYLISFIVISLIVVIYFQLLRCKVNVTPTGVRFILNYQPDEKESSPTEYKAGGTWYPMEIVEEF